MEKSYLKVKNKLLTVVFLMALISSVIILILFYNISKNKVIDFGSTNSGFRSLDSLNMVAKIKPEKAYELAMPFLDKLYGERKKDRSEKYNNPSMPIFDSVFLKKEWYYVVRESYPAKSASFYINYAIKVHKNTAVISLPWEQTSE
jgi:hypothetical protein